MLVERKVRQGIPTRTFHGWVKCHRREQENEVGNIVMSATFPFFEVNSEEVQRSELDNAVATVAKEKGIEVLEGRPVCRRRFAGDIRGLRNLDRGRYYTICENETGTDSGTLANELNAYCDPRRAGFGYVVDLSHPSSDLGHMPGWVAIYLSSIPGAPSKGLREAQERGLLPRSHTNATVLIPYGMSKVTIPDVLDLRYPDARDWLGQNFAEGCPDWLEFHGTPPPKDVAFYGLLPTLMELINGGNDLTDLIGSYLRLHGVNALVFPSARSNTYVEFTNGVLGISGGWNLVDFRNATKEALKWKLVVVTDWAGFEDPKIRIEAAGPNSPYAGSFRVIGNVEHHNLLRHLLLCFQVWQECGESTLVSGYRWHRTRIVNKGSGKVVTVRCVQCEHEFEEIPALFDIPNQCPQCAAARCFIP